MRHLAMLLAIALFMSQPLSAQTGRHEISLGYGAGTTSDFLDAFSDLIVTAVSGANYATKDESYSGAFHLTYKYLIQDRIGVGGTFAYEHGSADATLNGQPAGSVKRDYFTLAAEADYRYIHKPKFSLYSGLGLGYSLHDETYRPASGQESSENTGHFNFQVIGIGARFGGRFGGFAEAGFGYKGLVCIGIFGRF